MQRLKVSSTQCAPNGATGEHGHVSSTFYVFTHSFYHVSVNCLAMNCFIHCDTVRVIWTEG